MTPQVQMTKYNTNNDVQKATDGLLYAIIGNGYPLVRKPYTDDNKKVNSNRGFDEIGSLLRTEDFLILIHPKEKQVTAGRQRSRRQFIMLCQFFFCGDREKGQKAKTRVRIQILHLADPSLIPGIS